MENFSEKLKNAFKQVEKHEKIVFELQADKDGVKYDVYTQDAESETQLDALQAELDSLQDELADAEVALVDLEAEEPEDSDTAQYAEWEESVSAAEAEIDDLEEEIDELEAKIETLEDAEA